MSEFIKPMAEWSALLIEAAGITVILVISLYAIGKMLVDLVRRNQTHQAYRDVRLNLGRGILLGLEFLVAADIIHTVAVDLSFETVGVLALIVLVRTFLSFALEVELNGRWPWQQKPEETH